MKKLSKILVVLLLVFACAAVFAACNPDDDGGQRMGEKCYVENVFNRSYGINIEYLTQYKNHPWAGYEPGDNDTGKTYFIKGDVVDIRLACRSEEYYLGDDFGLVINGEPITLTATTGRFWDGEPEMTFYAGKYTVQGDISVDVIGVKENTVNLTLTAQSDEDMLNEFQYNPNILLDYDEQRESFLHDNFFGDDANVYVRFANPSAFGLLKAEWHLNDLRKYVLDKGDVVGKIGVASGETVYVYSKGYNVKCTNPFELELSGQGDASIIPESYCYFDEDANEYGFKMLMRASPEFDEETQKPYYVDGKVKLTAYNDRNPTSEIRGSLQSKYPTKQEEFLLEDDIAEVPCDNPVFSVQFGEQLVGDWLRVESFREDGKLDVTVRLKKYGDPQWKALYDAMTIKVIDTVLRNGVDYTISPSGVINLVLDKPYSYVDISKIDPEHVERYGIYAFYMYNYEFYFDIIKLARDAGLVTAVDVQDPSYGGNDGLKIYFGDD